MLNRQARTENGGRHGAGSGDKSYIPRYVTNRLLYKTFPILTDVRLELIEDKEMPVSKFRPAFTVRHV